MTGWEGLPLGYATLHHSADVDETALGKPQRFAAFFLAKSCHRTEVQLRTLNISVLKQGGIMQGLFCFFFDFVGNLCFWVSCFVVRVFFPSDFFLGIIFAKLHILALIFL